MRRTRSTRSGTRLRAAVLAVLGLPVCVALPATAQEPTNLPPELERVVVLEFTNLGGDPSLAWVGPGTVASLRADLGQHGFQIVVADRTAETDPEHAADPGRAAVEIGTASGAHWVVWGSYQRMGPRLRLTGHLYELADGSETRTVRVEGPRDEVFDLQDEIVDTLIGYMRPSARVSDDATGSGASGLAVQAGVIQGPPPPVAPEVIRRDATGRATIRAVRVESLTVDGVLDDRVYQEVASASDFVMQEPQEGPPATERTEVWVLFDNDNVYVSARCWNSAPESDWIVNEMRRDSFNVSAGEFVGLLLDTFYDRRNGMNFGINPIGGRLDAQMTDERNVNMDWNPIWDLRTGRFDGGWTFEAAFPFKSLRYRPGRAQIWGFNMMRNVQWKNEVSFLVPMPAAPGQGAMMMSSLAATVVGIEAPEGAQSLEIKPYAITDLTSDRFSTSPVLSNELNGDVGLDVKYGVTQNLVADFTVNPDFAQVEADEQQVNLTRFSLFFPEKREFFLENQGVFTFGGTGAGPFGGGGDTPVMFYSRRIGLEDGREVPITVGGRLTGRVGAFSVGALSIQTNDEPVSGTPRTNFSVVRVKRDVLRRSSIGALFARRSHSTRGPGANETYGLDGTFGFFDNLAIDTYLAKTETSGLDDDISYRGQLDYRGDRYGVRLEHLAVGTDFNPEVGFLRRQDFERSFGQFRFSPRIRSSAVIRKLSWDGELDYVTDRAGLLETRVAQGRFGVEFENSDQVDVAYTRSYEFLKRPFQISQDVAIPVGGYSFDDVRASMTLGSHHRLAGTLSVQHGGFFDGNRTSVDFTRGRLEITPQLSIEPGVSFNWIDLPQGRFTTELVTARTTYTLTPQMFVSALLQYNSGNESLSTNVRMRWEYLPGSELFIVYNEQRDTLAPTFPELENRTFVIKINRLFRF